MGRVMSPRITYWTGIWDPAREALSKQVAALRQRVGPDSPVVSFSGGQRTARPRDGVIILSGARWLILRAVARAVEARGDVTHVFGAVDSWHMLRALGRRPIVLTAAIPGEPLTPEMYRGVKLFAAESEPIAATLIEAGVPRDDVELVYPGIDLAHFVPSPPPDGPFTLQFASTPSAPAEMERRGIPLMMEVARRAPDLRIVLRWRQWGDVTGARAALAALRPPPNVRIDFRDAIDMRSALAEAHATITLFADRFGKSCPNSVIEGLACGRPAIVSTGCGIADLITRSGAGRGSRRSADDVLQAIEDVRRDYDTFARGARALAESCFDLNRFFAAYESIYDRVARRGASLTPAAADLDAQPLAGALYDTGA
jgi:glycosyltransferase involved in cell wall biosynthesis